MLVIEGRIRIMRKLDQYNLKKGSRQMTQQIEKCEQNGGNGFKWNQGGIWRAFSRRNIQIMKILSRWAIAINSWLRFWGKNQASAEIRKNNRNIWIFLVFKKKLRKDKPETHEIVTHSEWVEMGRENREWNGTSLNVPFTYSWLVDHVNVLLIQKLNKGGVKN